MAACVFLAMLGLALLVMPHSSGTSDAPMGSSPEMGDRRDSSGATPQVAPGTSGGASPSRATGVEGSEGRTRPTARGGCAGSPSTDASTTPGALMFAFVLGVALAWGAGYLVERRGARLSSENLRAGRQVATFLASLVAVLSVLVRLSAVSAAREVAPPPDTPTELAEEEDAAVPPDAPEATGPFARFLRRRRTTHGPPRAAASTVRARRRREPPPPPPPRAPLSPLTTFAAGLVAGLVLSPRWRAIARGER
jgi:hypothetical protein